MIKNIILQDKIQSALWREANHIPKVLDATYSGYTGIKIFRFPVSQNCRHYPDITDGYDEFSSNLVKDVMHIKKKPLHRFKLMKMFLHNFATGEKWDTKFNPEFPGRDINGRVQYARYNNKIVTGNYISNHLYGLMCAAAGIPKKISLFLAKLYSCGIMEPFISKKIPNKNLLKFRDPASDQLAIIEGYKAFSKLNL